MECGLIGLQGVGKTTLFTALTAHAVEVQPGAMKPSVGVASIPDPRLDRIADFIDTKEVIHATLQVVDIPGVPTGGSALANVLAHVRQVDALCHVVRCFDFGMGRPTPGSDIAAMNAELLIADLVVVEAAIDTRRIGGYASGGQAAARPSTLSRSTRGWRSTYVRLTRPCFRRSMPDFTRQSTGHDTIITNVG